jgi:hypothetical protein
MVSTVRGSNQMQEKSSLTLQGSAVTQPISFVSRGHLTAGEKSKRLSKETS